MKRFSIMTAILFFGFISGIFAQHNGELSPEDPATGITLGKNTVTVTRSDATGIGAENGVMRRDPSDIIKAGDFYYVWYSKGTIVSGYDATIWYATSTDGHEWIEKGMALPKGEPGRWDAASVFTPNILVAEGKYWLFYTGTSKPYKQPFSPDSKIGIAVSDSPDGPWQRLATNPALKNSDDPKAFDSHLVDDACLIKRKGKYWFYYKGRQLDKSPAQTQMGLAIADKPDGPYVRVKENPVISGNHEVLVWPQGKGVAAMIGTTGPKEITNTIQYADDGIHFSKTHDVKDGPWAGGAYRPEAFTDGGTSDIPEWGVEIGRAKGHLPFIQRFDVMTRHRSISMLQCLSQIGTPTAGQSPASDSATGRLELVGVTPYSNLQTSFSDASGKKYPHFIALAHAAGANSVRLGYHVGEDRSDFYAQAEEVKKRGMQMVCTIYVNVDEEKDFASVLAATERQCRDAYNDLKSRSLTPVLLLVGNEINTSEGHINRWADWKTQEGDFMTNLAASLNAGAKGLRAAGYKGDIGVHIDRSWVGFYTGLIEKGYTDYQVAAISVYPKWGDSKTTVNQKIELMHKLATEHKKKILVIETAAPYVDKGNYKTQDFDPELVVEVSPRGQALHLEKVCNLVLAIPEGRGLGVITWGSDLTTGIHKWDHVTWNRAQVTKERVALPSLYVLGKYGKLAEPTRKR